MESQEGPGVYMSETIYVQTMTAKAWPAAFCAGAHQEGVGTGGDWRVWALSTGTAASELCCKLSHGIAGSVLPQLPVFQEMPEIQFFFM
jgi:hypothetical protein